MGMSRDTFHRDKSAVDEGGVDALFERMEAARLCALLPPGGSFLNDHDGSVLNAD